MRNLSINLYRIHVCYMNTVMYVHVCYMNTILHHLIYSVQYYPLFHVTAVGLGMYYPWIWGSACICYTLVQPSGAERHVVFQGAGCNCLTIQHKALLAVFPWLFSLEFARQEYNLHPAFCRLHCANNCGTKQ